MDTIPYCKHCGDTMTRKHPNTIQTNLGIRRTRMQQAGSQTKQVWEHTNTHTNTNTNTRTNKHTHTNLLNKLDHGYHPILQALRWYYDKETPQQHVDQLGIRRTRMQQAGSQTKQVWDTHKQTNTHTHTYTHTHTHFLFIFYFIIFIYSFIFPKVKYW